MGWSRPYKAILDENRALLLNAHGKRANKEFAQQLAGQLEAHRKAQKIQEALPDDLTQVCDFPLSSCCYCLSWL
jgi:hypothetical protein